MLRLGCHAVFHTKRFLVDNFATVQGLISFLRAYGVALPKFSAVEKWFQRESIPSDWLPVLLAYLELDQGKPVSLTPYLAGD